MTISQIEMAIQQRDWPLASQHLQQLIAEAEATQPKDQTRPFLPDEDLQYLGELALVIFTQADGFTCRAIARLLPQLGPGVLQPLKEMVTDVEADFDQRWLAGQMLSKSRYPQAMAHLISLLDHDDEEAAMIAARAITQCGPAAISALTPLLNHAELQRPAVQAIAQICHPDIVPPLLSVTAAADPQVRAIAIAALSNFRSPEILSVLLNGLKDPAVAVRKEATTALGAYPAEAKTRLAHLRPLLYDLNLGICQQAVLAIARLNLPEAIEALVVLLRSAHTPLPLQCQAVQALGWSGSPLAIGAFQALLTAPDTPTALLLKTVQTLSRLEPDTLKPQAVQLLRDFFNTHPEVAHSSDLRQAIAFAWGELGDPSIQPILAQLETDAHPKVQLNAAAARKRLASVSVED